ncbi:unnamed protein product [Amoebophrya sp. A25]|nr:unnamed protein product [Amoebophrya sp. A25]|eukprot:GSA25T00015582001.1
MSWVRKNMETKQSNGRGSPAAVFLIGALFTSAPFLVGANSWLDTNLLGAAKNVTLVLLFHAFQIIFLAVLLSNALQAAMTYPSPQDHTEGHEDESLPLLLGNIGAPGQRALYFSSMEAPQAEDKDASLETGSRWSQYLYARIDSWALLLGSVLLLVHPTLVVLSDSQVVSINTTGGPTPQSSLLRFSATILGYATVASVVVRTRFSLLS